jgi:hypothetical protein
MLHNTIEEQLNRELDLGKTVVTHPACQGGDKGVTSLAWFIYISKVVALTVKMFGHA